VRPKAVALVLPAMLLVAGGAASRAQDTAVRASVEPQQIAAGEQTVLSVEVSGPAANQMSPPDLSAIEDFEVVSGPSVSTRFQWINGRTSSSRTFAYVLRPKKTGTLTIPALGLLVQGRTYHTRALEVEIGPVGSARPQGGGVAPGPGFGGAPSAPGGMGPAGPRRGTAQGGNDVRVRTEVDGRTVYVGQQITARFVLDTQTEVLNLGLKDTPNFPGFWTEEIKIPDNLELKRVQIGGEPYNEYTLMKRALFPTGAGTVTIPPVAYQIQVRRRTQDPIESFFFTPTETVVRRTDPVVVEVLPLPAAGKPPGFSGAVGSFSLSVTTDRKEAKVNDAVGVKVRLSGEGNLNAVTASPLPELNDFKEYSPKVSATTSFLGERMRGDKVWDYVLIPLAPGTQTVPALSFAFFDPRARQYRTVESAPIPIQIARGEGGGPSYPAVAQSDVRQLRQDIHYIRTAPGGLADRSGRFYRAPLFLVLLVLPAAADLGLYAWARRRDRSPLSLRARRERRARSVARRRLKEARRRLSPSTSRAFYAAVAQALTGYVADKFDTSAAGLTHQRIQELLSERGVPEELRAAYHRSLEACDFARFAPSSSAGDEMRRALRSAEDTLVALERALSA
jgi:hypothetical protein